MSYRVLSDYSTRRILVLAWSCNPRPGVGLKIKEGGRTVGEFVLLPPDTDALSRALATMVSTRETEERTLTEQR